jgi:hypothetical protein
VNNLKKYSADLERTLITTPLIRRNKNGTVVLQESILKSRIKKLENLIEKALTPPTSEEVCEALGEELNVIIVYKDKEFYYDWEFNGTSGISLIVGYYENVIKFYDHCLSPQSLSLVARFYEEVEE